MSGVEAWRSPAESTWMVWGQQRPLTFKGKKIHSCKKLHKDITAERPQKHMSGDLIVPCGIWKESGVSCLAFCAISEKTMEILQFPFSP